MRTAAGTVHVKGDKTVRLHRLGIIGTGRKSYIGICGSGQINLHIPIGLIHMVLGIFGQL